MQKSSSKRGRPRRGRVRNMRSRLLQKLPAMLDAAIEAYQRIATCPPSDDPKLFAASQTGAKAALAHIEQIIDFAETALKQEDAQAGTDSERIETLLGTARKALEADRNHTSQDGGNRADD